MLTAKQEKFINGLISGMSQREAYRAAYDCQHMKPETIDSKACNLLKNNKVRARYAEIIEEYRRRAVWDRDQAVKSLIWLLENALDDIVSKGIKTANTSAAISAIKELNSMAGLYHSDRIQAEKLELEKAKAAQGDSMEDKISEYMDVLKGVFKS